MTCRSALGATLFVLMWCVAVVDAQQPSASDRVRVFVFTAPADFLDYESERRMDSVADIKKQLKGKKTVLLVDSREAAGITVEVLSSMPVDINELRTDTAPNAWTGGVTSTTRAVSRKQLMLTLAVPGTEYATTFGARAREDVYMQGWGVLAKGVARQVEDWIKKNRSQLVSRAR